MFQNQQKRVLVDSKAMATAYLTLLTSENITVSWLTCQTPYLFCIRCPSFRIGFCNVASRVIENIIAVIKKQVNKIVFYFSNNYNYLNIFPVFIFLLPLTRAASCLTKYPFRYCVYTNRLHLEIEYICFIVLLSCQFKCTITHQCLKQTSFFTSVAKS